MDSLVSVTSFELDSNSYELIDDIRKYRQYVNRSDGTVVRGLKVTVGQGYAVDNDPYLKALCKTNSFTQCKALLNIKGYFKLDDSSYILIIPFFESSLAEYLEENSLNNDQIKNLVHDLGENFKLLHNTYDFTPSYITPYQIVVLDSERDKLNIRLVGLRDREVKNIPEDDLMWVSPERFKASKQPHGQPQINGEKELVYSLGLNILNVGNRSTPTQFRNGLSYTMLYQNERNNIPKEETKFGQAVLDSQLKTLVSNSLKYTFNVRARLDDWASFGGKGNGMNGSGSLPAIGRRSSFEAPREPHADRLSSLVKNTAVRDRESAIGTEEKFAGEGGLAVLQQHNLQQQRNEVQASSQPGLKTTCLECCEEPIDMCKEAFEKFWCVYGCLCGVIVSVFIILMSLGFE